MPPVGNGPRSPQDHLHRLAPQRPALALYRKFGFVEEARLRRHYRQRNGQLWDGVGMGLILDWESPGSPHDS